MAVPLVPETSGFSLHFSFSQGIHRSCLSGPALLQQKYKAKQTMLLAASPTRSSNRPALEINLIVTDYSMPDMVLSASHISSHLITPTLVEDEAKRN